MIPAICRKTRVAAGLEQADMEARIGFGEGFEIASLSRMSRQARSSSAMSCMWRGRRPCRRRRARSRGALRECRTEGPTRRSPARSSPAHGGRGYSIRFSDRRRCRPSSGCGPAGAIPAPDGLADHGAADAVAVAEVVFARQEGPSGVDFRTDVPRDGPHHAFAHSWTTRARRRIRCYRTVFDHIHIRLPRIMRDARRAPSRQPASIAAAL